MNKFNSKTILQTMLLTKYFTIQFNGLMSKMKIQMTLYN